MVGLRHRMVEDYLRQLDDAARVLGERERDELVGDMRARLDLALGSDPPETDVRRALDALGTPEEIVAALLPAGWVPPKPGRREKLALVLLLGLVPLAWPRPLVAMVLWLAGVALLTWSPLWSKGQKLLAALAWPLGIGLPFGLARLVVEPAGPTLGDPVVLLTIMTPAALLALWLYRVAGRQGVRV